MTCHPPRIFLRTATGHFSTFKSFTYTMGYLKPCGQPKMGVYSKFIMRKLHVTPSSNPGSAPVEAMLYLNNNLVLMSKNFELEYS